MKIGIITIVSFLGCLSAWSSSTSMSTQIEHELIEVASLDQRPTGLAISKQNRVFVSMPFSNYSNEQHTASVVEVVAYITDSVRGGVIVVNLQTGLSRMVLRNLPLANLERRTPPIVEGVRISDKQGNVDFLATDGIALDQEGTYIYFQYRPNSGSKVLYRVATKFLRDDSIFSQLDNKVEKVNATVVSDGIEIDTKNYIYLTDVERNAISRVSLHGKVEIVVQDKRIKWPDSIAFSIEGEIYFTIAQFHLLPALNNGVDKSVLPFFVYKVSKA